MSTSTPQPQPRCPHCGLSEPNTRFSKTRLFKSSRQRPCIPCGMAMARGRGELPVTVESRGVHVVSK